MKIESIIRRKEGTIVTFDDATYHFKPTPDDERHQAEVGVKSHAQRLLSITEGYRPLDGDVPANLKPKKEDITIVGSKVHAAQYTLSTGEVISLEELTSRAFTASGLSVTEWNELSDEDRYEQIDTTLAEIEADAVAGAPPVYYAAPSEIEAANTNDEPEVVVDQPTLTVKEGQQDPMPAAKVVEERQEKAEADEPTPAKETVQQAAVALEHNDSEQKDQAPALTAAQQTATLDREELAKQFEAKFGRKPNGKLSARSIQKALEED